MICVVLIQFILLLKLLTVNKFYSNTILISLTQKIQL